MSGSQAPPPSVRRGDGHVLVRVHVTPGARRAEVAPAENPQSSGLALRIKVRAKPQDGAANADVVATIARHLGLAKSRIDVLNGHSSRVKTLRICGSDTELEHVMARLSPKSEDG